MPANATRAVAYLRTSSATNVGEDKDSHKRQWEAIASYAKRVGIEVQQPPLYDAAVQGADSIHERPGFAALLAYIGENPDTRTILVEDARRFARDLIVQETGFRMLQERGITLVAVDSPSSFLDDTPTAVLIRQVLGAVAQFDKAMTVAKLRGARDRKRALTGKCEGRKSIAETQPAAVALARKLYRKNPATGERRSMREIAEGLAAAGFLNSKGNVYQITAVRRMLGVEAPRRATSA
jgi:DNA invertase Pin-like site-specific DNA recombinase